MARVKVEEIVEHLDHDLRRALAEAAEEVLPSGTRFDEYEFFRAFKRAVRRKCSTWERVPDRYVKPD